MPLVADVLTIGDSMTYGTNVLLGSDWPSVLSDRLAPLGAIVYNMSAGGWGGGVQYLEMFPEALFFEPRVVVVAFYTGNDALDSFKDAYGRASPSAWSQHRGDQACWGHQHGRSGPLRAAPVAVKESS